MAELAPAGVVAAFGFAGAAAGEALAVASCVLVSVCFSGEATGSTVASAGVGAAFGFAGAGEALAVASGVLVSVCFSGEATGSAVAVTPFSFVALGVVVDPGGHVIQHSAPAGNDRNVNPLTGMSMVSRRDFAFMIHPPFRFCFLLTPIFPSAFEKRKKAATPWISSGIAIVSPPFGGMEARERQIYGCRFKRLAPDQCGSSDEPIS